MDKSNLIILRGISGSGKSSMAEFIKQGRLIDHFEADMFFSLGGPYEFDVTKLAQSHRWCETSVETSMKYGKDVIVSNTFTRESEMKPYLDMAVKYDYRVTVMVVEKRHTNSDIHSVPDTTKEKQANRLRGSIKLI